MTNNFSSVCFLLQFFLWIMHLSYSDGIGVWLELSFLKVGLMVSYFFRHRINTAYLNFLYDCVLSLVLFVQNDYM